MGDLFEQDGHLVIGMTDTFDTEPPKIIATTSVQGQLLSRVYGGDVAQLDADLEGALSQSAIIARETRQSKPLGKLERYDIGTVAIIDRGYSKYYCLAYSRMSNDCVAQSNISRVWASLMSLWATVRNTADLEPVSIAVLGMGLARLSGQITQADMVRLIVISYLASSRELIVSSHLRIILTPESAKELDLRRLANYLATV